jgi:hypothetical protein
MQTEPKQFFDKNGNPIKAGDLIKLKSEVEIKKHPGREVVKRDWNESSYIALDEGETIGSSIEWVAFRVQWWGSCLVAKRESWSNFQRKPISDAVIYLNTHFQSELFEVLQESSGSDNGLDNSVSFVTSPGSGGY